MARKNSKDRSSMQHSPEGKAVQAVEDARQLAAAEGFKPVTDLVQRPGPLRHVGFPQEMPLESRVQQLSREAFLRARGIDPKGPMQLEMWPADMREMPNDYARSAIFTVRNKKEPRAALQGAVLFHVEKSVSVTFTGIELRADDDELVWLQILDYAKHYPLGEPVEFNLHELCKDLNWSINGRNYEAIRQCISRLKANEVKVTSERMGNGVAISLIHNYEFMGDGDKGTKYRVWIHPNLILLFAGNRSTRVTWDQYSGLKPIARRLYDYWASHKQPFPLRLDTFYKMCASTCQTTGKWKSMVKDACGEVQDAGLVRKAWVLNELIYCER